MKKTVRLLAQFIYNLKWGFIKKSWFLVPLKTTNANKITNTAFSLGITTYKERYETYLKPLIKQLNHLFPHHQIIVAINGFHNQQEQAVYLENIKTFLSNFSNVNFVYYNEPQGLCKLWNQLVIKAISPKIFLLNDDISVSKAFKKEIESTGILATNFSIINKSYSHFFIDKSIIKRVGWFDERFLGIGYEDHDFEIRLAQQHILPTFFTFKGVKNENVMPKDWSWGDSENKILKKYSSANEKHYFSKWEFSQTEKEGFIFVRIIQGYAKLKNGMETPNFYPNLELK